MHTQHEIIHDLTNFDFKKESRMEGDMFIMSDENIRIHVYKKAIVLWTDKGPTFLDLDFTTLLENINEYSGPYSK